MSNNFIDDGKEKYDKIEIPDDFDLTLKKTIKKARKSKKSVLMIKISSGIAAALLAFIFIVNFSPNTAYALNCIPLLKNFVQLVKIDKGFNNLVNNQRIQQINKTVEYKGAKFTLTTMAGDDSKLWIGYEFKGEGLAVGQVKFTSQDGNKELPWYIVGSRNNGKYMEVSVDKLVKNFTMEVSVYKDDLLFHKSIAMSDKEELESVKTKYDQNKFTTLRIPISLNSNLYKQDSVVINEENKEYKSEIGTFKITKLKLSESRSTVTCELDSDDYELIEVEDPMLVDKDGKEYPYASNYRNLATNNHITIDLAGGIQNTNSLTFKCSGMKYLNRKDKYISIDMKKKAIDSNGLGLEIESVESDKITLNTTKGIVNFDFSASDEGGNNIWINNITTDHLYNKQILQFKMPINSNKITLNVRDADNSKIDGFDLALGN